MNDTKQALLFTQAKEAFACLEERVKQLTQQIEEKNNIIWQLTHANAAAAVAAPQLASKPRAQVQEQGREEEDDDDLKDVPPAQRLIFPADVVDLSDLDMQELDWCGTMGLKITVMQGLDHLKKLHTVSLRSGFIRVIGGISHLKDTLEHLALYENRLRTLKGIEQLAKLQILDVSYNRLRVLEAEYLSPVGANLKKLYLAENKLTEINPSAFKTMTKLESLDLGGNEIRAIQGLENCTELTELWLGKNKITKIENLGTLTKLKKISIQSNRLVKIENLENLTQLEELYLSDQGIAVIEGLDALQHSLVVLDLTNNQLSSTVGLDQPRIFSNLTDLWLAANKYSSYDEILRLPASLPVIDTIMFDRNPIASDFEYRKRLKQTYKTLCYIDATACV